jgi:hypothetical protein
MGDQHSTRLRVGSVDDPAEAAADRTADVVVEQITTTRRSDTAETSLGDASGWTSRATRALFAEPAVPSPRVSRRTVRAPRARSADSTALHRTPLTAARVQRAATATPTPGSASGPDGGALDAGTAQRIQRASGRGAPLESSVRPDLESAFGASFDNVSVHADSPLPAEVGAIAFTHGSDIHFAPGQYRPDTSAGLHTLSHELAHVVQQGGASPTVHRLMSAPEFKASAKENLLQSHGKTMTEIDTQLEAYDALKKRGDHLKPGAGGIDKAINILRFLDADIRFWMDSHEGDKSRQKQRAALVALRDQVWAEVDTMYEIRDAALQHGLAEGNVQFEDNKFIQKMEGSASSILDRLSPIIAAAVPSPGDGAKLEISVKIPVDPSSSSYVGFGLAIGLQRQDRTTTKISLKASVNGGGKIHGVADVGGELGAFIEAQGKDPKAALQLVSWGWYRRFRESVLPREVASFMWGGSTGVVGWKRSETWAANIEKENLQYDPKKPLSSGVGSDSTTNAYVRTGAAGSATASGAIAGIASMEGSVGMSGGTHYDKDTVEARKKKRGGKLGEAEKMPARGKTTYLGTRFMKAEASLGVSVGPFSGALGGALEWLWDQTPVDPINDPKGKKVGGRLEYLSGSLSAGCSVPLGGVVADQIANGVVKLAPSVVNLIKTLTTKLRDDDETGAPEGVGQVIAQGEQLATAFQAFPQESFSFTDFSMDDTPMKSLGDQLQEGANLGESASSLSLSIAFGVNLWDRKAPISIDVTLNSEQGIQLDASIVSVVATRSRRVLRLKFNTKGEWSVD